VIPVKKGLRYSTPTTSALIYLFINTAILWIITLYNHPVELLLADGFIYFVFAGIIAPGIAARFKDIGISRLGVAISSPVMGINTLFSMLIAVVFLREKITLLILIGAILTFFGVSLISWQKESHNNWRKIDLIFPLTAAALFAMSTNLRKLGLIKISDPIIGATITSTVSLIVLIVSILYSHYRSLESWEVKFNIEGLKYFTINGVVLSIAYLFYFLALSSSSVVKIQPLSGINPLFSIIFGFIFLRGEETITPNIIIGTLMIVAGIVLITA
jgi:drug/metabolite transporter (DMT)-like permease